MPRRLAPLAALALLAAPAFATESDITIRYDTALQGKWRGLNESCEAVVGTWRFDAGEVTANGNRYRIETQESDPASVFLDLRNTATDKSMELIVSPRRGHLVVYGPDFTTELVPCADAKTPAAETPRAVYLRDFEGLWRSPQASCAAIAGTWHFGHNRVRADGTGYHLRDVSGADGTVLLQIENVETARRLEVALTLTAPDSATAAGGGGVTELERCRMPGEEEC